MRTAPRTKVLIVVAALIAAYVIFGPSDEPAVEAAKDSGAHPAAARAHGTRPREYGGASAAQALAQFARRVVDGNEAGALFAAHSWYVAPPPPPPAPVVVAPPPKPTAPPLPYQFIGSYTPVGGKPVIFLTRGDVVYDVHVGDALENTYSVDKLEGGQLYLTYKPLNIQQQLNAEGAQ